METRLDPTATFKGLLATEDDLVVDGALEDPSIPRRW